MIPKVFPLSFWISSEITGNFWIVVTTMVFPLAKIRPLFSRSFRTRPAANGPAETVSTSEH